MNSDTAHAGQNHERRINEALRQISSATPPQGIEDRIKTRLVRAQMDEAAHFHRDRSSPFLALRSEPQLARWPALPSWQAASPTPTGFSPRCRASSGSHRLPASDPQAQSARQTAPLRRPRQAVLARSVTCRRAAPSSRRSRKGQRA